MARFRSIESYLRLSPGETHLLLHLEFCHHRITMELASTPEDAPALIEPVHAHFPHAVVTSIKEAGAAREDWPLEITRFHCVRDAGRWHFVLDCPTIQWRWTSGWPLLVMEGCPAFSPQRSSPPWSSLSPRPRLLPRH